MSRLRDEFRNPDYRRAYAESLANTIIATQLRLLRGKLTQKQFAEVTGIKQSRVSTMEDENYTSWSTRILRQLAAKCDVVFIGRFMSFGECLEQARRMRPGDLTPIPFSRDPAFAEPRSISKETLMEVGTDAEGVSPELSTSRVLKFPLRGATMMPAAPMFGSTGDGDITDAGIDDTGGRIYSHGR